VAPRRGKAAHLDHPRKHLHVLEQHRHRPTLRSGALFALV
jgi:hypothetical protein